MLVDHWFGEEREHSRLLGQAVRRFGGKEIKSHWSFTAFCACRRVIGVRAELQILLLTELSALPITVCCEDMLTTNR